VSVFFRGHDLRRDVTSERLSSLSSKTVELLEELNIERPVHIDAFVSPSVPESYLQTQLNVLAMLRELEARGGNNVKLRINRPDRFGPEAERARQRYDITPRRVVTSTRGTMSEDYIFMGVAFTSGLDKVILPFIDRGIPVEYELVRSIASVTQQKRRRIGILQTDAKLYGQFNMQTMAPPRNWPIVEELEKQYEVVRVDATNPITERYDALLAVQPSSLGPEQMRNFLAAVRNGQATAIFEDPFPVFAGGVPATTEPRRPPGGMNPMMMGRQPPMPKGDAERQQLWTMLGVDFGEDKIIWHDYNPYPKLSFLEKEFVFVGAGLKGEPFNESAEISSGLQNMLFPFPGSIMKLPSSDLQFTALVRTGVEAGTVDYRDMRQRSMFGMGGGLNPNRLQVLGSMSYVLAAQIRGRLAESLPMAAEEAKEASKSEPAEAAAGAKKAAGAEPPEAKKPDTKKDEKQVPKPAPPEINVVLVADIDMLSEQFFRLREVGDVPESGIHFDFDNVTFVLNLLDSLAGDERFIEIRKRRPTHRTLTRIDERTEAARKETARTRKDLQDDFERVKEEEQKKLDESIEKMKKRFEKNQSRAGEFMASIALAQRDGQRRLEANAKRLEQEKDRKINEIETRLNMENRQLQDWYKMWAVVLPPIPPLLVAVFVFFTRRAREKEGVSRSRLRG